MGYVKFRPPRHAGEPILPRHTGVSSAAKTGILRAVAESRTFIRVSNPSPGT
jgi:hypothetical protein